MNKNIDSHAIEEKWDKSTFYYRFWVELDQTKTNHYALLIYTDYARAVNRTVNWIVAIIAALGAICTGFKFYEPAAFIATILIMIEQFVKNVSPKILQPDEELYKLDSLTSFYGRYMS